MMTLKWVSPDGTELVFSRDAVDYHLISYEGFEKIPVNHQMTVAPFQDGQTLIDSPLQSREMSITLQIKVPDLVTLGVDTATLAEQTDAQIIARKALERALIAAFNVKKGPGYLIYTNEAGVEYWIACIGNNTPTFAKKNPPHYRDVYIDLIAPDPYFLSGTREPIYLAGTTSTFFRSGDFFPFTLGKNNDSITVTNIGDVPAPVTLSIVGEIVNPIITNATTGESLEITLSMAAGDRFIITTHFGNKAATYYRADGSSEEGMQYLGSNPQFWSLALGENTIELTDTSIGTDSFISIEWRDRFIGVA